MSDVRKKVNGESLVGHETCGPRTALSKLTSTIKLIFKLF